MWRQQACSANLDSDQSISDEDDDEELGHDWPGNCVSLAASAEKKERFEILSRLELLKGTHESGTKTSILSHEIIIVRNGCNHKPTSSNFEDDVEMPNFYDEGDSIGALKKAMSKDEVLPELSTRYRAKKSPEDAVLRFGIENKDSSYSWSSASKEAEALMQLNEHASCYSKPKKSSKVKEKGKPRFSFRFQSHKEGLSSPSTCKDKNDLLLSILDVPERLDVTEENLVAELPEDIQGEEENASEFMPHEVEALRHECSEQSMAELLDGLCDNSSLPRRNLGKNNSKRGKRLKLFIRSNMSPLKNITVDKEDSPDLVHNSESSSDTEIRDKDVEVATPRMNRQTIVDQFQDAFGGTFLNDYRALNTVSKPQGSGLFWKLQQVMQSEKEREVDFVLKLKSGAYQNERGCSYVKILTKSLDGRLTVCDCFFSHSFESVARSQPLEEMANEGTKRIIIFQPKVPNSLDNVNVDLEVGNCICIHPPWKEVQVGNEKIIILAYYFSNFQSTSSGFSE